jgi:PTS system nitrogen regulatory IIA component
MELADILSEESVLFCPGLSSKSEVLEILARHAALVTGEDEQLILSAITEREALGSTGLGNGIAIPHGKIAGLHGVTALFLRTNTAVEFDAVDDRPVDLMMLLLAPVGGGAEHLRALARVARLLRTDSVTEELRATVEPARLHAILTQKLVASQAA